MKENFSYEEHLDSVKDSLEIGTSIVGGVFRGVYKASKPLVEARVHEIIRVRAELKEQRKGV
jgi:hypothetical protein